MLRIFVVSDGFRYRHLVDFILEMLINRSFTLHTYDGQHSRLRRLKNGVPQGSLLTPMLYVHDLLPTFAKKYGYADNLAILLSDKRWATIEEGLTVDVSTLSSYLKNWRLKLLIPSQQSRGKTQAQSHGGWPRTAVQGYTDVPWSEARPDPDLSTIPGEDVSENTIPSLSDTPPRRNHLGSRNEGHPHFHPGSGLLRRRVLCTGLLQKSTHK